MSESDYIAQIQVLSVRYQVTGTKKQKPDKALYKNQQDNLHTCRQLMPPEVGSQKEDRNRTLYPFSSHLSPSKLWWP